MSNTSNGEYYKFIGEGQQGRVFQLSPYCCIKIYKDSKYAAREMKAYKAAKGSPIIPKLYESGPNYIIMEYVQGNTLKEYIQKQGQITETLAAKIIALLKEMNRLGFTRLDAALRHIFVTEEKELKIIDLTNSYRHKSSTPRMLLSGLEKLGQKDAFLEHVKKLEPVTYDDWTNRASQSQLIME